MKNRKKTSNSPFFSDHKTLFFFRQTGRKSFFIKDFLPI